MEKRGHPRYDILAQIRVKRGTVVHLMDVSNISLSGAFVATDSVAAQRWLRVGQELELDLFTTDDLDNVRVTGRVVRILDQERTGARGFGVEFMRLEGGTADRLRRIVALAAERSIHPPPLPGMR
jgi:c-di-GMP-binding flagellar brake protein YcgR